MVCWGSEYSIQFLVSNCVRQDCILSRCIFNPYMNDLGTKLSAMTTGCMCNGILYNNLMYATDMVLLIKYKLKINDDKTELLFISSVHAKFKYFIFSGHLCKAH